MFLKSSDYTYITSLEIENVKCFKEKQTLHFTDSSGRIYQWNILLGDNGTGKTTLLRSIYLTDLNNEEPNEHQYIDTLNFNDSSKITISYGILSENISRNVTRYRNKIKNGFAFFTTFSSKHEFVSEENEIEHNLLIAYGANRIGEKGVFLSFDKDNSTLIDDDAELINVEKYLINLDYLRRKEESKKSEREFKIVNDILKKVLPDVEKTRIITRGRIPFVEFLMHEEWVEYQDLSLGYQTVTAWMVDLAVRMFEKFSRHKDPLAQPAVVMVDEIDLHMHPRWQQKIMRHLSEQFPKIQFIVTAHSPLIVQSATNANVIVLKRQGNQVVVDNDPISVKNWRIDQILASDMFGISMRDEETTQKLNRRRALLQKEKLTTNEKKELANLEKEAANLPTSESPEMIKAMEIIKQVANNLTK
jgi:predicted ATP-binding protein involved in virulence